MSTTTPPAAFRTSISSFALQHHASDSKDSSLQPTSPPLAATVSAIHHSNLTLRFKRISEDDLAGSASSKPDKLSSLSAILAPAPVRPPLNYARCLFARRKADGITTPTKSLPPCLRPGPTSPPPQSDIGMPPGQLTSTTLAFGLPQSDSFLSPAHRNVRCTAMLLLSCVTGDDASRAGMQSKLAAQVQAGNNYLIGKSYAYLIEQWLLLRAAILCRSADDNRTDCWFKLGALVKNLVGLRQSHFDGFTAKSDTYLLEKAVSVLDVESTQALLDAGVGHQRPPCYLSQLSDGRKSRWPFVALTANHDADSPDVVVDGRRAQIFKDLMQAAVKYYSELESDNHEFALRCLEEAYEEALFSAGKLKDIELMAHTTQFLKQNSSHIRVAGTVCIKQLDCIKIQRNIDQKYNQNIFKWRLDISDQNKKAGDKSYEILTKLVQRKDVETLEAVLSLKILSVNAVASYGNVTVLHEIGRLGLGLGLGFGFGKRDRDAHEMVCRVACTMAEMLLKAGANPRLKATQHPDRKQTKDALYAIDWAQASGNTALVNILRSGMDVTTHRSGLLRPLRPLRPLGRGQAVSN